MTHTVAVGEFEGPLGLLLELVERKKLEVTTISIAEITAGYLDRVKALEQISPEDLSEFVQLGTRLLYIKSLALLPQETDAIQQDEELRQLNQELAEYRQMQAAAQLLGQTGDRRTWSRRAVEQLKPTELPLPNINLDRLGQVFAEALKRTQPDPEQTLRHRTISLQAVTTALRGRLTSGFELQDVLRECSTRQEVVVTFLALLELIRQGQARVTQADQFAPITVEAAVHA